MMKFSSNEASPNTCNETKINRENSECHTRLLKLRFLKVDFCVRLAKMNISVVKIFVQQNLWTSKITFL